MNARNGFLRAFGDRQEAGAALMTSAYMLFGGISAILAKDESVNIRLRGKEAVMLVLSRRPSEKILFPHLGISVEILQTKGNTVRVGIEAPPEIRVLRDELAESADFENDYPVSLSSEADMAQFEQSHRDHLCRQIDDIGLALALAQNQQRQGLTDNVDIALEQAIERLQNLKVTLQSNNIDTSTEQSAVCENRVEYERNRPNSTGTLLQLATSSNQKLGTPFRLSFELVLAD